MSEETEKEATESEESEAKEQDRFKNLQAEFSRKQENMDEKLNGLSQSNAQLLSQLQEMTAAQQKVESAPVEKSADLSTLMYDDPDKFAAVIEKRAEEKIIKRYDEVEKNRDAKQKIFNDIVKDFPESQDDNHPLTKRALEIFTAAGSKDPYMLQAAVYQAAAEQGIKPKSRREEPTEEFQMGSGPKTRIQRKREMEDEELPYETSEFAKLMNYDMDDPEVVKRLKKRTEKYRQRINKEKDYK